MSKKYRTDILFPRSNMIRGAGSIFNLAGRYFKFYTPGTDEEADALALENDWGVVANHFKAVISANPAHHQKENSLICE